MERNFANINREERKKLARKISDTESNNEILLNVYKQIYEELSQIFECHRNSYKENKFDKEFKKAINKHKIDEKYANAVKEQVYWKILYSKYKYQKPEPFKGDLANANIIFININPAIADENKNSDIPNEKTSDDDTYDYFRDALKNYDIEGKVPNAYQGAIKIVDVIEKYRGNSSIMSDKKSRHGNKYQAEDVRALHEKKVAIIDLIPIRSDHPKNVSGFLNEDARESIKNKLEASNAEIVLLSGNIAKNYKEFIEEVTGKNVKVEILYKHISYIDQKTCRSIARKLRK